MQKCQATKTADTGNKSKPPAKSKMLLATAAMLALTTAAGLLVTMRAGHCEPIGMDDLAGEQAKEKLELEDMGKELKSIKGEVNGAMQGMNELSNMLHDRAANPAKEIHLFAKEAQIDLGGTTRVKAMTYNGSIPGPQIDVVEGQPVRIVLHNQMKVPTSLHFHGVIVPHDVDGLPRSKSGPSTNAGGPGSLSTGPRGGLPPSKAGFRSAPGTTSDAPFANLPERFVKPGDSYGYQFIPQGPGTYYYHPQVVHLDQRAHGLYGALIVHPRSGHPADIDQVLFLGTLKNDSDPAAAPVYVVNGKTAPYIPPLEVRNGSRVRLRLINVCEDSIPLHLSGHKMEVMATSGSDLLEPQVFRDTLTINPGDRIDVEFTAGNIGVWSLASEKVSQTTSGGKFPGGIALFVRYQEMKAQTP
jgi:FtsP/CotA-like multicopper oxidase with cupredoxin domain